MLVDYGLVDQRPKRLGRLHFRGVGGLEDEADAFRHDEPRLAVPTGVVEHKNDDPVAPCAGFFGKQAQQRLEAGLGYPVRDVPEALAGGRKNERRHVEPFEGDGGRARSAARRPPLRPGGSPASGRAGARRQRTSRSAYRGGASPPRRRCQPLFLRCLVPRQSPPSGCAAEASESTDRSPATPPSRVAAPARPSPVRTGCVLIGASPLSRLGTNSVLTRLISSASIVRPDWRRNSGGRPEEMPATFCRCSIAIGEWTRDSDAAFVQDGRRFSDRPSYSKMSN